MNQERKFLDAVMIKYLMMISFKTQSMYKNLIIFFLKFSRDKLIYTTTLYVTKMLFTHELFQKLCKKTTCD